MRIRPTLRAKPKAIPFVERALLPRAVGVVCAILLGSLGNGELPTLLRANAANLPTDTGASAAQRGTLAGLVPLVEMQSAIRAASAALPDVGACARALDAVPTQEVAFKRTFDEFSEGVSYKQVWRDQNAFLVYYTGGFDGVGRPSIENDTPSEERQRQQYGLRNEAWLAIADVRSELDFLRKSDATSDVDGEVRAVLRRADAALDSYLALVPEPLLADARAAARRPP